MRDFSSFGAFARHLGVVALEGEEVTRHIAEDSAKIIQRDAKAKLGHYQDATGPMDNDFPAWAELADSTKEDRVSQGFPENEPLLRTGELRDSIEIAVEGGEAVVGSASDIALWQELGTDPANGHPIPPRPFLGSAAFEAKENICSNAEATAVAWICGLGWKRPRQLSELP